MRQFGWPVGCVVLVNCLLLAGGGSYQAVAQESAPPPESLQKLYPGRPYSPYAGSAVPTRVYDVAVSDGRAIDADGRCRTPVGNTVDLANATWSNTIGDPELITVWEDPDFDPSQRAFYYARVLEIPTPRWTAYDARYYGVDMPEGVRMMTQERGYTSPIWYTPER